MKFGEAITLLNAGHPVTRQGWNGKGMFLIRAGGYIVEADKVKPNGIINAEFLARRGLDHLEILPHIDMWTINSEGRQAYLPGWLASQSDMLAEDWMEYKEPVEEKKPNTFTLNPQQVQAMKDAGVWDDPIKKAKIIKRYYEESLNAPPKIKKPHWTQTPKGKKIMAARKRKGQ